MPEYTKQADADVFTDVRDYIGSDDCAVATCTERQEFPDAECPYCIVHSIENFFSDDGT